MTRTVPNAARATNSRTRVPYESPAVYRVRVAGDELAVAGCKQAAAGGGPNPPSCSKSICKTTGS